MAAWRGVFRQRGQKGQPNRAWVTDEDLGDWVDEADYHLATHISPPWKELPWAGEED